MILNRFSSFFKNVVAIQLGISTPKLVTINLTSRCNQRCVYCEVGRDIGLPEKFEVALDDLRWIIDQMAEHKIPKLALFGGEPFLYGNIFDVISYAHDRGLRTSITSNGSLIHTLKPRELQLLRDCHTEMSISIDSFNERIDSFIRGTPTALSNALRSIQALKSANIPTIVSTVISDYNCSDLLATVIEAHKLGIAFVSFQPIIFNSNFHDRLPIPEKAKLNVSPDKLDILLEQLNSIINFEKSHSVKTNVHLLLPWIRYYIQSTASPESKECFFDKLLNTFFCWDLFSIITISYDGHIIACELSQTKTPLRSNRHLGLIQLWKMTNKATRYEILHKRYHPACNSCCNHFSRNLLASIIRHPFRNRSALGKVIPIFYKRIFPRKTVASL